MKVNLEASDHRENVISPNSLRQEGEAVFNRKMLRLQHKMKEFSLTYAIRRPDK